MDDTTPLHIAVLVGTSRVGRRSIHVAQFIVDVGRKRDDVTVELADPAMFDFPGDGNDEDAKDPQYTRITQNAEGFFIVTPEYNHSFSGSLKRMLDSESNYDHYIHKPVAFAGVSDGLWGGVRAIEALVPTVREMGMVATFADVQFPKVDTLFDDEGVLQDEAYIKRVNRSYDELVWMGRALRWGRKQLQR